MQKLALLLAFISSAQASNPGIVDYLKAPAAPVEVRTTLDESKQTLALVKAAQGGKLTLTGSDGVRYELIVPAGALGADTQVSLTEISAFAAGATTVKGVELGPDGLVLAQRAKLRVTLPNALQLETLAPVTADTNRELVLASITPGPITNPKSVDFELDHFSPYALTQSMTLREAALRGTTRMTQSRINTWLADQILKATKNGQSPDLKNVTQALVDALDEVIRPRGNMIDSCAGGIDVLASISAWHRQAQLFHVDLDEIVNNNFETVVRTKTGNLCKEAAIKACYQDHRPFDVAVWALSVHRQFQLLGWEDDPMDDELIQLMYKCLRFKLVIDSTIIVDDAANASVTAKTEVEMWMDHYSLPMRSRGQTQVTKMTFAPEGMSCAQTSLEAPAKEASVTDIGMNDIRFDQSLGVKFQVPTPSSIGRFMCTTEDDPPIRMEVPLPPQSGPDESFWGGMFLAFHSQPRANEFNQKKGLLEIYKWDVLYGEKFAEKKYDRPYEGMKEKTVMTVFHLPQPLNK